MNLGNEQYVSVTTFRKDGSPVATPVWVAQDGEAVVFWTVTASPKIRRIRNNPAVTVAACDFNGNVRGEVVKGTAEVLSDDETERVRGLLRKKYGLVGRLTLLGSRIRRGRTGTIGVKITDI